jgi:hypothetical protein
MCASSHGVDESRVMRFDLTCADLARRIRFGRVHASVHVHVHPLSYTLSPQLSSPLCVAATNSTGSSMAHEPTTAADATSAEETLASAIVALGNVTSGCVRESTEDVRRSL